jgi:hypothetical protein
VKTAVAESQKQKASSNSPNVGTMRDRTASPLSTVSQRPPRSASSQYSQQSPAAKTPTTARLRQQDIPIEESPTIPQSPGPGKYNPNRASRKEEPPPPVPEKDAKFIPLSKFAAKSYVARVEQAGVTVARMTRSATDSSISSPLSQHSSIMGTTTVNAETRSRPVRSDTMPERRSPMLTQQAYKPPPRFTPSQNGDSPLLGTGMAIIQAKPAAEVSMARTVSLSRKQSARVVVPGPKLQARRIEEKTKQQQQPMARSATPTGLGLMMSSSATVKPTEHSHKKSKSDSDFDHERYGPLNSNPSTPEGTVENPIERAAREKAQKAAIVEAAKARARARMRANSQTREETEKQKERDRIERYRDSQDNDERAKWEILEKRAMSPLLIENRGHKPGLSVNVIVEDG